MCNWINLKEDLNNLKKDFIYLNRSVRCLWWIGVLTVVNASALEASCRMTVAAFICQIRLLLHDHSRSQRNVQIQFKCRTMDKLSALAESLNCQ